MGRIEQGYLTTLQNLLKAAEQQGDTSTAAALRWAIYNLEYLYRA